MEQCHDLGVSMGPELKFSEQIEIQLNKTQELICRSYEYMDGEILKNLFITLAKPHQDFGHIVWFPRFIKIRKLIEGVQKRVTK